MKLNAALAKTLLMSASIGMVVPVRAAPSKPKTPTNGAKAPAPTPTPAAVDPASIVIPGTVLERKGGGYVSLTLEGGNFLLSFYDSKKSQVAPNAPRAAAHWNPKQKSGEDRTILTAKPDGSALKGARFVKPPFPIKVYITLLDVEGGGTENYIFNFRP